MLKLQAMTQTENHAISPEEPRK